MRITTDFETAGRALASPGSAIEEKLTALWAEVLLRETVGIHDDFFDLGGNSLLAVNLFARIESQLGERVPVSTIIEAPTISQLARLLETGATPDPVVTLRKGGDEPPLFLIHDADGETMLYRGLAQRLDPARTVYGLQPHALPNHPNLDTRMEEMAAFQIRNIRSLQPKGPYLLGGLCAGGHIAFEIARQLQRNGEEVAMVALLDAADVAAKEKPLRFLKQRLNSFVSTLEPNSGPGSTVRHSIPKRALGLAGKALRKAGNLGKYLIHSGLQVMRDELRIGLFRVYRSRGWRLPEIAQRIPVRTTAQSARRHYRPSSAYDGQLLLFRATAGVGDDEPYPDRYSDPLLGWARRATGGVRPFDVPGGHSSMLQEPHVQVLARHLQSCLDEVSRRWPRDAQPVERPSLVQAAETRKHEPLEGPESGTPPPCTLLTFSATSREALQDESARVAEALESGPELTLSDLDDVRGPARPDLPWRRVVVGSSREQVIERLRKGSGKGVWSNSEPAVARPVAFLLAGVGEHVAGSGRSLYEAEPTFRDQVDRCADHLKPLMGQDIREVMFTATAQPGRWLRGDAGILKDTRVAQPAAFVLGWALAQMWQSWGVKPAALLGYSVGEFVAAALAGIVRLEDALTLVARRAEWIVARAQPGVMLAVPLPESEIRPRLGEDLWIAAVNSPQATVVGGPEAAIERLEDELKKADVVTRRVESAQGSHTPLLEPAREELRRLVATLRREPPRIPMLSNVTGSWLSAEESQADDYWGDHMCGTVRFEAGVEALLRDPDRVLLEVGPGAGLGAMVRQHSGFSRERNGRVLASLPSAWDRVTDCEHVAGVLGRLWVEGVEVNRERFDAKRLDPNGE